MARKIPHFERVRRVWEVREHSPDYVAKLSDPAFRGANLLVVRKIEETNRDSTFAELQAAIYRMFGPYADRFWKVNLNPLALECRTTGTGSFSGA